MASTVLAVSDGDVTTQVLTSNQTLHQTLSIFLNMEDYLEIKNKQFVATLVPTLSYLAIGILCGLAGNTLVFMVYYKKFKPSVTRTYILAMSVCDLMQNMLSLPIDIVELRFYNTFEERWLCKCFRAVKSFLTFTSASILVAVAFDRQRAICSPESNPTSVRHAVVVLVEVSASALAITVPFTILAGPRTVRYEGSHMTGRECSVEDMYAESLFLFIYNVITGLILIIGIGLMLVSYVLIARQLWLHRKNTAIILNAAAGKDIKNVQNNQPSDKANGNLPKTVIGNSPIHKNSRKNLKTAMNNQVERPNKIHSPPSKDCVDNLSSDSDANFADNHKPTSNAEKGHFRIETGSPNMNGNPLPGVTIQSNGQQTHDSMQDGKEPFGSSTVRSQIRHTVGEAKACVSHRKPTSKQRGSARKIPNRTTFMMFVLTVIFIINFLPHLILVSVFSREGMGPLVEALGINGYHIGLRSYFINSFINPLVYSFCSIKFRRECRSLFKCN